MTMNGQKSQSGDMNAAKAVTEVNKTPKSVVEAPSSAVTGRNQTPMLSSIEMDMENADTRGNEMPTPSSEEKVKEIQAEIKKMHKNIGISTGVLYVCAFVFRRKKERRERIGVESPQTTERKTDEKSTVLKRKHDDQQRVETLKEDGEPMTAKNSTKDSSEASALTGSIQKLDLQGKDMSDLKSVSSLQEETEKQKSDNGKSERNIKLAVEMMTALRGSNCHDYAVFRSLKGSFDDHFRGLLYQSGVLGSTEATVGGGKKETNTDCVIQSLAKRNVKEMQQTFFGSKSVFDPSDELDMKTIQYLEDYENHMRDLYRLYLAEESEKNKMVNNGADLKRKKTENMVDCDVKSCLEKEEGSQE